ncbi:LTA synthase family protein [Oleiagrimonas soli]|uniref:Phosphoglycerol transferase MdoB-like AlkP superfamily enzyme n=1 Tax=Oleiagrimonas soli TaxID=1543381 RepID=A0A099CWA4_9GAMM|nr:LTA synthase family protein [Oleiagrimonas soli]KGI77936.1 sulfatase [Oleiagrimonas soli]MBB6183692.1 phosphoglycerol transferase MdoB-like AlkP superfamily enzyme [Oleiagrimonas soli]
MSRHFASPHPLRQRFRPLVWLGICFLVISFLTRLVLLVKTGDGVPASPLYWLYIFAVGLGYDLVAFLYFAWPMVLFLWLVPTRPGRLSGGLRWFAVTLLLVAICGAVLLGLHLAYHATLKVAWPVLIPFLFMLPLTAFTYTSRTGRTVLYGFCAILMFAMLFIAAAEWTFWNEFSARFNFIAVDYLVYTREVVGNIEESYPVGLWLTIIALIALAVMFFSRRTLRARDDGSTFAGRTVVVLGWLAATVLSVFLVNANMRNQTANRYVNDLGGNGIYQFFAAFRADQLNFDQFYKTLPDDQAYATVRKMLKTPDATYVSDDPRDLTRAIRNPGPEKHLNVVLISVESLSGRYMAHFGNKYNLTPHLDKLADESMFFTRMYANGTRTVRGLEALSLSVPPTPGDSLVKQKNNGGLFSLADIFNQHGYVSEFVYGGYGEFDNMNPFFAANGYKAVDRRAIPADMKIHSENVWGVSDEDLFSLAMLQMDKIHKQGKPFFLHIMTTSNHRPYTFPEGRVKGQQKTRFGALRYTDWAINDFIQRMRKKSYFDDTVFVITADHCAHSAGSAEIPVNHYHIPLIIYAPAQFKPQVVNRMMAQMDIPPTLLGLLHFSYRSRFFGYDVFKLAPDERERAFPSTYQRLGYLKGDTLTILSPRKEVEQVTPNFANGDVKPVASVDQAQVDEAIASYQVAYETFHNGQMKWRASDATPVAPLPAPAASAAMPATAASAFAPAPAASTTQP